MTRPSEIAALSGNDFAAYYWLKTDLVAFCRTNKLPTSGSKQTLTERVKCFLETGEVMHPNPTRDSHGPMKMPVTFTRQTVIGSHWRCSQELRAFFETEIGPSFHFNQFMRNFIKHDGIGQTLEAAMDGWHLSKREQKRTKEIEPQFEYNRHFREYFAQNRGATREQAILSWHDKKSRRKEDVHKEKI